MAHWCVNRLQNFFAVPTTIIARPTLRLGTVVVDVVDAVRIGSYKTGDVKWEHE